MSSRSSVGEPDLLQEQHVDAADIYDDDDEHEHHTSPFEDSQYTSDPLYSEEDGTRAGASESMYTSTTDTTGKQIRSVKNRRHRSNAVPTAKLLTQTWLRVDPHGNATLVTTDKYKVAIKLGVQPRDLRLLDPQMASVSPPAILDRERAIVVNLGQIKCIITLEYVLVVNPETEVAAQLVAVLRDRLSNPMHIGKVVSYPGLSRITSMTRRAQQAAAGGSAHGPVIGLSFELKVLEVCLDQAVDALDASAVQLEKLIIPTLDELTRKVTQGKLEVMRRGKNRLTHLVKRVETIKEVLEKFLQDDEDMHKLNLTAQELTRQLSLLGHTQDLHGHSGRNSRRSSRRGSIRSGSSASSKSSKSSRSSMSLEGEAEVAEVEMMLEAYQMHLDHLYNKLQTLERFVQDTEDLVNTSLDTHRNRIFSVDIVLTSFYTALGLGTAVSSLFGANIQYHSLLDEDINNFAIVGAGGAVAAPMFLLILFLFWAKHQRLVAF